MHYDKLLCEETKCIELCSTHFAVTGQNAECLGALQKQEYVCEKMYSIMRLYTTA